MLRFTSAGRSHPGLVRDNNEDAAFAGPYLQLVADGVGGAAAGEVASATAAYVASAKACACVDQDPLVVLENAVPLVQQQLQAGVEADPTRGGMATTLTALLVGGGRCALLHVGDSRAYLRRGDQLRQVSRDHTFVQTLVDDGLLSPAEAREHPRKNVVLQALDGTGYARPDLTVLEVQVGDRLLVCSDGLTDLVDDGQIAAALGHPDTDAAAQALLDAALSAGGHDNVTCLVADVGDGPRLVPDGKMLGALADPDLVVNPAAVRSQAV